MRKDTRTHHSNQFQSLCRRWFVVSALFRVFKNANKKLSSSPFFSPLENQRWSSFIDVKEAKWNYATEKDKFQMLKR